MKYTPDIKYEKSCRLVEYLTEDKPLPRSYNTIGEEEMLDLLLYHIKVKEDYNKKLSQKIKEYQSVFDTMSKFITPKKTIIY
jgi:hypothetical protein